MRNRPSSRLGRAGFTLLELLVVVGVAAVVIVGAGALIASKLDSVNKANKASAQALCDNTAAASPGSFTVTEAQVPAAVATDLGADLSPIFSRSVEWRRRTVGDAVVCEMRYCFSGRRAGGAALVNSCEPTWVPTS